QDIPGLQVLRRHGVEHPPQGKCGRPDEPRDADARLREKPAILVQEHAGEVIRLPDDRRERGALQRRPGFVHYGDQPTPVDLQIDRIQSIHPPLLPCARRPTAMSATPRASRLKLSSGATTIVEPGCSIRAGPSCTRPAASALASITGVSTNPP